MWPTSYAAAPDFLADDRLEPTLQRDPTPAGLGIPFHAGENGCQRSKKIMPKRACAGEWRGAGAGGSPQHATFFANQQFRLKLSATAYSHS